MSFNLVDLIKEQLSDQVTGYVGNMVGRGTDQSESILEAGVPAILDGLLRTSSTQKGADTIFETLQNTNDSILDNIGDMLSGDRSSSLIDTGIKMLGSVLGNSNNGGLSGIIGAISSYSGADRSASRSVLGLLAPIIFSVIKKKLMGSGRLSVSSIIDLFSEQKDNIASAVPKGLDLKFEDGKFIAVDEVKPRESSSIGKILPLLILLAVAWFAYKTFFNKPTPQAAPPTHNTANAATVDLAGSTGKTMESIISMLDSIKDSDSAKAALGSLTAATNDLGKYAKMLKGAPVAEQNKTKQMVAGFLPKLKSVLEKIGAIPGVETTLKPFVDTLGKQLSSF